MCVQPLQLTGPRLGVGTAGFSTFGSPHFRVGRPFKDTDLPAVLSTHVPSSTGRHKYMLNSCLGELVVCREGALAGKTLLNSPPVHESVRTKP